MFYLVLVLRECLKNPATIYVFLIDFVMPKKRMNRHYFGLREARVEWKPLDLQVYLREHKKKTQAGDNDKLVGQFVGQGGCLIEYPEILEILILIDAVAEVAAAVVVASVRE